MKERFKLIKLNKKFSCLPHKIKYFRQLDSTNSYLKRNWHSSQAREYIIIAGYQSQGRGRFNRVWQSAQAKNLMFSAPLSLSDITPNNSKLITIIAGLAVKHVLQSYVKTQVVIKWPNDILIDNLKLAGILTERIFNPENDFCIIGIGININQQSFGNFAATSLSAHCKKKIDKLSLLNSILTQLDGLILDFKLNPPSKLLQLWWKNSNLNQVCIQLKQDGKIYETVGLNEEGLLIIKNKNEFKTIDHSEFKIRR